MMSEPLRVSVLTADAGFGHRSAANAISAALQERYAERVEVEVANPLDDSSVPPFLRVLQSDYDKIVTQWPDFWKLNYELSDRRASAAVLDQALTVILYRAVRDVLRARQPQVVVTTHPFFMAPLNAYLTLHKLNIPYLVSVTDLTNTHRMWFNRGANLVLMPTQEAFDQAADHGFPSDHMDVTGIPVNPAFVNEAHSAAEIRTEFGWRLDLPAVLVVGSKRVKNLMPMLQAMDASEHAFQLVLVAGGDDGLYSEFQAYAWRRPVQTYNFVRTLPKFMHASDMIVSKAGGLIVSESMACNLPMLLVDVTPGQEEGNAGFIIQRGAAEWARHPEEAREILDRWQDNGQTVLAQRARAAARVGRPGSAFRVAELAWQASERGRWVPVSRLRRWATRFRKLLKAFDITEDS